MLPTSFLRGRTLLTFSLVIALSFLAVAVFHQRGASAQGGAGARDSQAAETVKAELQRLEADISLFTERSRPPRAVADGAGYGAARLEAQDLQQRLDALSGRAAGGGDALAINNSIAALRESLLRGEEAAERLAEQGRRDATGAERGQDERAGAADAGTKADGQIVLPAATGTITGTVTDAPSGFPGSGITVSIFNYAGVQVASGTTNASGVYSATGLPTGIYYARTSNASTVGSIDKLYNNIDCPFGRCTTSLGAEISVTDGATTSNINFALNRGGTITGTIRDAATNALLSGATVGVYNASGTLVASGPTNASGVYTIMGLPAGTYFVDVLTSSQGYIQRLYNNIDCPLGFCKFTSGTPITVTAGATTSNIDVSLNKGGVITGKVVDAATNAPLSGISVDILNSSGIRLFSATTNASGDYTTGQGLPTGTYFARTFNTLGYVEKLFNNIDCPLGQCTVTSGTAISVTTGATTPNINFSLNKGAVITGTVKDAATNAPLSGARVTIFNSSGSQISSYTTNASGVYTTATGGTGLPAGTYFARTFTTPGYVEKLFNNIDCPLGQCTVTSGTAISVTTGGTASNIDFALNKGGSISGKVTDSSGSPLLGVGVRIFDASGTTIVATGTTNSSGDYTTTTGLPAGTYFATTTNTQGYADRLYDGKDCAGGLCSPASGTPITVGEGATISNINFALPRGGRITGVVRDAVTNAPLSGVGVDIFDSSGRLMGVSATNLSGVFVGNTGLTTGTYFAVTVNSIGYVEKLFNNIDCPLGQCAATSGTAISVTTGATTSNINFALNRGGTITGTIRDAATNAPLSGVSVDIFNSSGVRVMSVSTNGALGRNAPGAYTTENGTGLPAGTYFARTSNSQGYIDKLFNNIDCPGGACTVTSGTPITVSAGATASNINFALNRGGTITGTVTDTANAAPLSGVQVNIFNSSGTQVGVAVTNSSGVYSATGFSTGTYHATTSNPPGYVNQTFAGTPCSVSLGCSRIGTPIQVTAGSTTSSVNFALTKGGTITGTVTDASNAAPLADVSVVIFDEYGSSVSAPRTNASGVFALSGLPTGTYYARTFSTPGYVEKLYDNKDCPFGSCATTSGNPISVMAGGTTPNINFALNKGGTITGTVTDAANASPLSGITVNIFNSSGSQVATGTTNSSGTYTTTTGLPAGTYFARTSNSQGYIEKLFNNTDCALGLCTVTSGTPITVAAGATTPNINFSLAKGGRITGTVRDAANSASLVGVGVSIFNSSGTQVASATADSSGVYVTGTGLPAGTYFARTSNTLGYIEKLFNNTDCALRLCTVTSGTPITVTAGAAAPNINFSLVKGGAITGAVKDAASGFSAPGVSVIIFNSAGDPVAFDTTDAAGFYSSDTGLPPGTYFVRAGGTFFVTKLYDNKDCPFGLCNPQSGTPVTVAAGATTANINLALNRGGRISGTVTDAATSAPLPNVVVFIFNSNGTLVNSLTNNAAGGYVTLSNLPPGTYFAKTVNSLGYTDKLFNNIQCPLGNCAVTSGTAISVAANATATGVNFALAKGGSITGTVTDAATNAPLSGVTVKFFNSSGTEVGSVVTNSSGVYSAPGLTTGNLFVLTSNAQGYVDKLYKDIQCPGGSCAITSGGPVELGPGSFASGVDFALKKGTSIVRFGSATFSANEGAGSATITVKRVGSTTGAATVDFATSDGTAKQRTDYLVTTGTLTFAAGQDTQTFTVLITKDAYQEGNETLTLTLSNPSTGMILDTPVTATLTIADDASAPTNVNPIDDSQNFVGQHYQDFLSRAADAGGLGFWTAEINKCGSDAACVGRRRIEVSNAFFFELEYQQTAAYVFRLYRAAFGNSQPFPNPDSADPNVKPADQAEARKIPSYDAFTPDRARVVGGIDLAASQLALANQFVLRPKFLEKYPASLTGQQFVDAVLANIKTDSGVDLSSQSGALLALFNSGGRGAVMYRLADDNAQSNPVNNRAFIDAEYNRAFVTSQYYGYLRRDADIGGLLFWLFQVNKFPLRSTGIQNAMVCSFITSREYQERFGATVTRTNQECPQ